jgi:hypothetical protein
MELNPAVRVVTARNKELKNIYPPEEGRGARRGREEKENEKVRECKKDCRQ